MEFLLEIMTEEMPSSHVQAGQAQLEENLRAELESARLPVISLKTFGTCRRLIVVGDLGRRQDDKEEVVIGPPKKVGLAPDGSPTAAAKGFARAQNVDVARLEVIPTPRGEYLGVKKTVTGKPAEEILASLLPRIISSLTFPKMMRWGEGAFRFSRPVKNILCLFGGKRVDFSLHGKTSTDFTTGHKLHKPKKIQVRSFREYKALLKKSLVLIDAAERKELIRRNSGKKLLRLKGNVYPDEELLDKLSYDVEWPHVFVGKFPEDYLGLPLEVLSGALREGQKLFSVVRDGRQLPFFVGVADTPGDPKSLILKGNERVLRARLEDARFFWQQDLKIPLAKRVAGLDVVVFQEKLGTYREKILRLKTLGSYVCDKIDDKSLKKNVIQAAELCKADLLTEMVREFPSLQGKVGGLYARAEGYPEAVVRAIYEHYKPVSLEDSTPDSLTGAVLSLADKLDSVVGVVGIGIQASGSSDPFGIRRNATGICQVILDKKLNLSFSRLLEKAISAYGGVLERPPDEVLASCLNLFIQRLRYIYETQGYRYDLVNAALGAGIDNIFYSYLRLKALDDLKKSPSFASLILMAKRVNNIIRGVPSCRVAPELLAEKEERELFSTFSIIAENVQRLVDTGDFARAQNMILKMQAPLSTFFEKVLVMTEDKKIRQNRLALLHAISGLLLQVADYSQVMAEGEK
ncbi:MAG: glycine--tRNA ligase subunit beta [Clostridiales bacterium]|nr:glycine--tRNA ligase subunit beta [Clostridiales bacterium]